MVKENNRPTPSHTVSNLYDCFFNGAQKEVFKLHKSFIKIGFYLLCSIFKVFWSHVITLCEKNTNI